MALLSSSWKYISQDTYSVEATNLTNTLVKDTSPSLVFLFFWGRAQKIPLHKSFRSG